ncbi:hypothetical protein RND81_01G164700 [Saponaria officinalis]|uniref:Neprosin PEP catalytic domain-containing protein n=1 Tax=Saponaria officinalis TaxID=3572 RepID=A0AAW1NJ84_SAPOF
MAAGDDNDLNTIEMGWRVVPALGYNDPRIFIYWTRDNYGSTGCYNLDCPGFVQTIPQAYIGGKYLNISAYDGVQFDADYDVRLDPQTNNWWITVMGSPQGYYPSQIFTKMATAADILGWGGETRDNVDEYYDTPTQMGNGHLPTEGFRKACYMTSMTYIDNNDAEITPTAHDLDPVATADLCYDLNFDGTNPLFMYFGGPGCPK